MVTDRLEWTKRKANLITRLQEQLEHLIRQVYVVVQMNSIELVINCRRLFLPILPSLCHDAVRRRCITLLAGANCRMVGHSESGAKRRCGSTSSHS